MIQHDLRTHDGLTISVVFDPDCAEPEAVRIKGTHDDEPIGWALPERTRAQFAAMAMNHWRRQQDGQPI